jgi:hypothetical protein
MAIFFEFNDNNNRYKGGLVTMTNLFCYEVLSTYRYKGGLPYIFYTYTRGTSCIDTDRAGCG